MFIKIGAIILPGITIGDYFVFDAGIKVTKDIPTNSIEEEVSAKATKMIEQYFYDTKYKIFWSSNINPDEK